MEPKAILRQYSLKATRTAEAVLSLLAGSDPLAVPDILRALAQQGITANKTTLYRLLRKLAEKRAVNELSLQPGVIHYELVALAAHDHHHHLICQSCRKVEHLAHELVETSVRKIEAELARVTEFADISHSLEFYGYCRQCRS
jgi:Fe2+ or Zn2+ uptake regulation protein